MKNRFRNLIFPIIWTVLFFVYFLSSVGLMNSADAPQFSQAEALVEQRTLNLNNYSKYIWPDYIEYKGNVFTKRDPGAGLINIPFYLISKIFFKQINGLLIPNRILEERELKLALITYSFSTLWTVLMLYFFNKILEKFNAGILIRILFIFSLGLGSLFWRQSYTFTRQTIISFLTLVIVWLVLNFEKNTNGRNSKNIQIFSWLGLGIITGLIIFIDLTAVIIIIPFCLWYLFLILKVKKFSDLKIFLICFSGGLLLGSAGLLIYNQVNFGKPIKPPYLGDQYLTDFNKVENYFAADLTKVIPLILFSQNKNPSVDTIDYFKKMPDLARKISAEWFIKKRFQGIFYISPLMYLSFFSLYFLLKKKSETPKIIWIFWAAALSWVIFISKYSGFFAANSFNTSYYLPVIPLLHIISAISLNKILSFNIKPSFVKMFIWIILIGLALLSIFRGWENHLTNYAPHVTGDNKIDPYLFDCYSCLRNNVRLLISSTFPNWPNISIGVIFWLITISSIYFVKKSRLFNTGQINDRK